MQKIYIPIPLSSETQPELSFSKTADLVSFKVVKGEEAGSWLAEFTVDATGKKPREISQLPPLSGTIKATAGGQSVELPFDFTPVAIAPESLAYAAPSTLTFLTADNKAVTKKLFLTNNYPRALTFTCGSIFSQSVPANSIAMVDVKPVSSTTICVLNLDGVATRQIISFDVQPVSDVSEADMDVLADSTRVENRPINFKDCANGYCNCAQLRDALDSFGSAVSSHVAQINGQATPDSVKTLYPDGFVEKAVLRTSTFDDLGDNRLGVCEGQLAGGNFDYLPGQVYEIGIKTTQTDGWLAIDGQSPLNPVILLPQWSYSTTDGIKANQDEFVRMIEAS